MNVLLIEDSARLQASLGRALRKSGFAVDVVGDGSEGLRLATTADYDVIVLDLMLPGLDGLSVLRELRAQEGSSQVLILTARDTVADRVLGLQTGADDYLVKPFALEELLARVGALCRRRYRRQSPQVVVGDLVVDTATRTAKCRGELLELTTREFMLLEYLALRSGEVVSRAEIEGHLYPDSAELTSNVVDSAICILRRKLARPGVGALIHTRRGMGYVLEPAPR